MNNTHQCHYDNQANHCTPKWWESGCIWPGAQVWPRLVTLTGAGRRVTAAACQQSEVSRAVVRTWVTALPPVTSHHSDNRDQSAETRDTNTGVSDSVILCVSSHHPRSQKQGWSENQWSGRNIYRESHQFLLHWPDRISSDNILEAPDTVTSQRNQVNIPKL